MTKVISTNESEQRIFKDIERVDSWLAALRETIRQGDVVGDTASGATGEVAA